MLVTYRATSPFTRLVLVGTLLLLPACQLTPEEQLRQGIVGVWEADYGDEGLLIELDQAGNGKLTEWKGQDERREGSVSALYTIEGEDVLLRWGNEEKSPLRLTWEFHGTDHANITLEGPDARPRTIAFVRQSVDE